LFGGQPGMISGATGALAVVQRELMKEVCTLFLRCLVWFTL
jgi:MFS superfamily sulfate permease-like transporter